MYTLIYSEDQMRTVIFKKIQEPTRSYMIYVQNHMRLCKSRPKLPAWPLIFGPSFICAQYEYVQNAHV